MTSARRAKTRGPGRPSDSVPGKSRTAILTAARDLFAKQGFLGTTTRAIASKARVDTSLVHYFFQTKEKLFAAAVELPVAPEQLKAVLEAAMRERATGERLVRFMLENVFTSRSHAVAALIRAAVADPGSVPPLRSLIENTVVAAAASSIRGSDGRLRAELLGATMVGLFVVRHVVRVEPLASASPAQVAKWLGPAIDAIVGRR